MTLLNKQNPIVSKELNTNDKEVLAFILYKPKRFRDFSQKDKIELLQYLIILYDVLGIKDRPPNEQIKHLAKLIIEEYPTFTKMELEKAINMAVMGKLEVENNPYQALTPMYISNIIKAYKSKRQNVYQKYKQIQAKTQREKPIKNISKKEAFFIALDLVEMEYKDYLNDVENYVDTEFRNSQFKHIYRFLREYNIIKEYIYKTEEELKKYIVSWFAMLNTKKTTPTKYLKSILDKK